MEKAKLGKKRKLSTGTKLGDNISILEKFQAFLEAKLTYLWIRQIQNELRMEREAKRLCRKRKVSNYVV